MGYPINSSRKVKVRKGIETIRLARRTSGGGPSKKGLFCNNRVARVSNEEAVWISLGRSTNLRAVRRSRTRGMIARSLSPAVSPQVGFVSASHMKLPVNTQIAEVNNATGMKNDEAIITGLMKICSRNVCRWETGAPTVMRMHRRGTLWRKVVYERSILYRLDSLGVKKRMITEKSRQNVRLEHQIIVQMESLYFRRALETCLGPGRENTAQGQVFPSQGSNESVGDDKTRGRGGIKDRVDCWGWYLGRWDGTSCSGEPSSLEIEDLSEDESEG
jgi:hypothetical protein